MGGWVCVCVGGGGVKEREWAFSKQMKRQKKQQDKVEEHERR